MIIELKGNELQVVGNWTAYAGTSVVAAFFDKDGETICCATEQEVFVFRAPFSGELHPVGKLQPLQFLRSEDDKITAAEASSRTSSEFMMGTVKGVAAIINF